MTENDGDSVNVIVSEVDPDAVRLSLGVRECIMLSLSVSESAAVFVVLRVSE